MNKNLTIAIAGFVVVVAAVAVLTGSKPSGKDPNPAKTFRKSGEISMGELARLSGCELSAVSSGETANYDSFAKCLTDKGVKMYGAYWCGHCDNQKKAFGDSFSHINYIECADPNIKGQLAVCSKEKIESYPTWEFPDESGS